jgi:hypothetical protein
MIAEFVDENITVPLGKMVCKKYASEQEEQEDMDKAFISSMLLEHYYALINDKKYTNLDEIMKLRNSGNVVDFRQATSQDYHDEKKYLYVPFDYKDDAKKLGAKFDGKIKKWYVDTNNPNKQKLIDLYHDRNFIGKTIVDHDKLITYEERCQEIESEILLEEEEYKMRKKYIEINGNDDKFDDWYVTLD